jgi:hypothetical protein
VNATLRPDTRELLLWTKKPKSAGRDACSALTRRLPERSVGPPYWEVLA